MGRPPKLTKHVADTIVDGFRRFPRIYRILRSPVFQNEDFGMLGHIIKVAMNGDAEALSWLADKSYIAVSYTEEGFSSEVKRYDNQFGRYSNAAKAWTKSVLANANYQCERCGQKGDLQAHHLKLWARFPQLRFALSNGEAICRSCHALEHPKQANLILKSRYSRHVRKE